MPIVMLCISCQYISRLVVVFLIVIYLSCRDPPEAEGEVAEEGGANSNKGAGGNRAGATTGAAVEEVDTEVSSCLVHLFMKK